MAAQSPEGREGVYPAEDEIDLADLVAVLVRRWRLIVAFTLIVVLLAAGMSLWQGMNRTEAAPNWQFRALVELPYVPATPSPNAEGLSAGFVPIEPASAALHRLRAIADAEGADIPALWREFEFALPETEEGQQEKGKQAGGLIRVQATLAKRQEVESALNALVERLGNEYAGRLGGREDSVQSVRLVAAPAWSKQPADAESPNYRLNVALGLVLGLFLSVFLAFLMEFWVNNRARILAAAGERPIE